MIELLSCCTATFRKSLAKVTRPAAAPPLRTSILKTACYTSRPVSLLDATLWTSSPETSARHIPTSSIRLMEGHKPCTTEGFWHGAQARKARPLTTPGWMSSLFAVARSLRSTSFSIPNLHSGRGTLAACPRIQREFRTSGGERFCTGKWVVILLAPPTEGGFAKILAPRVE